MSAGEEEEGGSESTSHMRVKLYELVNNQWEDRGCGHVDCHFSMEGGGRLTLVVRSEVDDAVLLDSVVLKRGHSYKKQQDTLIVWQEPAQVEKALSFQEKLSCDEVYDVITRFLRNVEDSEDDDLGGPAVAPAPRREGDSSDDSPLQPGRKGSRLSGNDSPLALPLCQYSNVREIAGLLAQPSMYMRDKIIRAITQSHYIKQLLELCVMAQDMEDREGLVGLYVVFRGLVLLNDRGLLGELFGCDHIMAVVGVLEHDPDSAEPHPYTAFLEQRITFKQAVPLNDPQLEARIHYAYRLHYVRDVVLAKIADESTQGLLQSIEQVVQSEIVTDVLHKPQLLSEMFGLLASTETGPEQRQDLALFVQELVTMARSNTYISRDHFYQQMYQQGLADVFAANLVAADRRTRLAIVDVLYHAIQAEPTSIREHIVRQYAGVKGGTVQREQWLLGVVVGCIVDDGSGPMRSQICDVLRHILDLDPQDSLEPTYYQAEAKIKRSEFLGMFYEHCFVPLTTPLLDLHDEDQPGEASEQHVTVLYNVVELLAHLATAHRDKAKNYILHAGLVEKVALLLKSDHKFLALAALRFLRILVGLNNQFYDRHMVQKDVFRHIVEALVHTGTRYNMMNSAMVEFFDHLRARRDNRLLVMHVGERFRHEFEQVAYVKTFKELLVRYQDYLDHPTDAASHTQRGSRDQERLPLPDPPPSPVGGGPLDGGCSVSSSDDQSPPPCYEACDTASSADTDTSDPPSPTTDQHRGTKRGAEGDRPHTKRLRHDGDTEAAGGEDVCSKQEEAGTEEAHGQQPQAEGGGEEVGGGDGEGAHGQAVQAEGQRLEPAQAQVEQAGAGTGGPTSQ